jgi:hypothetical protein
VRRGQAAPRPHLPFEARRKLEGEPRRDERALERLQHEVGVEIGAEIHAGRER